MPAFEALAAQPGSTFVQDDDAEVGVGGIDLLEPGRDLDERVLDQVGSDCRGAGDQVREPDHRHVALDVQVDQHRVLDQDRPTGRSRSGHPRRAGTGRPIVRIHHSAIHNS
jgi:hypothetical protein